MNLCKEEMLRPTKVRDRVRDKEMIEKRPGTSESQLTDQNLVEKIG